MSPARYITLTRAALWSLTIIVVSGGAVRLTGSGLGCSDWPRCEEDQFVASLEYHAMIEFLNRMFTGVVAVAVIAAVLGSLRRSPRRDDLVRWSWGLVAGVVAQIVLGGLLVRTELDPRFTMGHFLLSMVLLWNAVVLVDLARRPDEPVVPPNGDDGEPPSTDGAVRLRRTAVAAGALAAVLLVSGTIVTGSGPHSGSDEAEVAERLPFLVRDVTRIHSVIAIATLALVLLVGRRAISQGRVGAARQAGIVAALLVAQGLVGYVQYFNGVPPLLVGIHITLASLAWIATVRLVLECRPVAARRPVMETVT